jgi:hypothetical protein
MPLAELTESHACWNGRTTEVRYPEEPAGLLVLDPQKICDSWAQEALKLH